MNRRASSRMSQQVLEPLGPLVHPGHRLDLVADLLVAGQVAGPVAILDPELLGGLALGGEVLGLGPVVHHLGGQEGDLAPDAFISHGKGCADLSPSRRRGARCGDADRISRIESRSRECDGRITPRKP